MGNKIYFFLFLAWICLSCERKQSKDEFAKDFFNDNRLENFELFKDVGIDTRANVFLVAFIKDSVSYSVKNFTQDDVNSLNLEKLPSGKEQVSKSYLENLSLEERKNKIHKIISKFKPMHIGRLKYKSELGVIFFYREDLNLMIAKIERDNPYTKIFGNTSNWNKINDQWFYNR